MEEFMKTKDFIKMLFFLIIYKEKIWLKFIP